MHAIHANNWMYANGFGKLLIPAALLAMAPATACTPDMRFPTERFVKDMADIESRRMDAHDLNMTGQHQTMTPEHAIAIAEQRDWTRAEFDKLVTELENLEVDVAAAIADFTRLAGDVASKFVGISLPLDAWLNQHDVTMKSSLDDRFDDARAAMQTAVADATRNLREQLLEKLADNALAKQLTDRQIQDLETALQRNGAQLIQLAATIPDAEQRRIAIADELQRIGVSADTITKLKGASENDFYELLGILLGAGALGAAGGRFGPSRGQKDLEALTRKTEETARLAEKAITTRPQ
jgi:hypothetical protein